MPSSLIFVALAAAWLIILVPMFARRRQEVSRTTDSALAARVVRRGSDRHRAEPGEADTDKVQEAFGMRDTERDDAGARAAVDAEPGFDEEYQYEQEPDDQRRQLHSDDVRAGRRYRPGRGGFDPEAAALAARAKYARRQRIVLVILFAAVTTALLGGVVWTAAWWLHGVTDLVLIGYLAYLRRQVHIEEEVRSRRLARMSNDSEGEDDEYLESSEYGSYDDDRDRTDEPQRDRAREGTDEVDGAETEERPPRTAREIAARANMVAVDIDDEDPMFDELDERTWQPYRRAAGE